MLCDDVGVLRGLKLFPRVDVPTGSSISVAESRNEGRPSENLARKIREWQHAIAMLIIDIRDN